MVKTPSIKNLLPNLHVGILASDSKQYNKINFCKPVVVDATHALRAYREIIENIMKKGCKQIFTVLQIYPGIPAITPGITLPV